MTPAVYIDVDGTLIDRYDKPRPHIREFFDRIASQGGDIFVWSAGGKPYAEMKLRRLEREFGVLPVREVLSKGLGLVHVGLAFYIDDAEGVITAMESLGKGTYLISYYEGNDDDTELLRAAERYLGYCATRRTDSDSVRAG